MIIHNTHNNYSISHYKKHPKTRFVQQTINLRFLLLRGGDIEQHPGPPTTLDNLTKKFPKHIKKQCSTYFQKGTISLRQPNTHLAHTFEAFSKPTITPHHLHFPNLVDFYSTCSKFPQTHILFALTCIIAPTPNYAITILKQMPKVT